MSLELCTQILAKKSILLNIGIKKQEQTKQEQTKQENNK